MNPEALRMLRFLWWTVIIKMLEMFETVFFLLRKKKHQASFLHVHHHISSLILIWAGVKYVGGGITSFTPMVNNAVHIIMYTYYLLSSEGSPAVKNVLMKHKKWITTMQMIQFTVVLIHASQVYLPSCDAPLGVSCLYFPNVIFVYYMFYDFFKKNYTGGQNGKIVNNGMKKNLEKRLL
ncbi:elongation of very long chain fatty acids protein 7-like [Manduca sexta]|uniref:elongation of very long chain fatty acids protein 7-like n=1 Tax=Manduca sexta TaxID=7130 RepID=UPI0018909CAC|nr:elongation of very long chain fatty acids protein 7-like [Manduca sexta]